MISKLTENRIVYTNLNKLNGTTNLRYHNKTTNMCDYVKLLLQFNRSDNFMKTCTINL